MKTKERTNQSTEKLNPQGEELADLQATVEQAQQTKGGPNYAKIEFEYKQQKPDSTLD